MSITVTNTIRAAIDRAGLSLEACYQLVRRTPISPRQFSRVVNEANRIPSVPLLIALQTVLDAKPSDLLDIKTATRDAL